MTSTLAPLLPGGVAAEMARQPAVLAAVGEHNAASLDAARRAVAGARTVRLAALGSSRHAAGFGAAALDLVAGVPAVVLPAVGRAVPLPATAAADVFIAVSQSGATPALVDAAVQASRAGATVIAVVNDVRARLSAAADIVLDCRAAPEKAIAATASVTSQMLLLRLLAGAVATSDLQELVRGADEALLARPNLPASPPEHVVASGFAAEWVADEAALKLAEMAGMLPSADSVVDHLHGPAAVVRPTLAFVDAADPNVAGLLASPHVYTVGPDSACDLVVGRVHDPTLDAIVRVITGQVVALHWAHALGVDPDDSRGLSKVTASW